MCEHTLRGSSLYSELDTAQWLQQYAYRMLIGQLYQYSYTQNSIGHTLHAGCCSLLSAVPSAVPAEGELSPALRPAIMSYLISTPHALCVSLWVEVAFRYSSRISSPSQYPKRTDIDGKQI